MPKKIKIILASLAALLGFGGGYVVLGGRTAINYWDKDYNTNTLTPRNGETVSSTNAFFTSTTIDNVVFTESTITNADITNIDVDKLTFTNILGIETSTTTELLVDGSFENWNTVEAPDDYFMILADYVYTGFEKSTDAYAGDYAIELTNNTALGEAYFSPSPVQSVEVSGEETVQVKAYVKAGTGTSQAGLMLVAADEENDYFYDFVAEEWVEGFVGIDQVELFSLTSSYAQIQSSTTTLPVGTVDAYYLVLGVGDENATILVDDLEFLVDEVDVITNGDFENWSTIVNQEDPLVSWSLGPTYNWSEDEGNWIEQTTSTQSGDYAVQLNVTYNEDLAYIYQQVTGTPSAVIDLSVYAKASDGASTTPYMVLTNGDPEKDSEAYTQVYDFITDTWDNQDSAMGFLIASDQSLALNTTTSWVQTTATTTIPASGELWVVLATSKGRDGESPDEYYFDVASGLLNLDVYEVDIDEPYNFVLVDTTANTSTLDIKTSLLDYCSTTSTYTMSFKDTGGQALAHNITLTTEGSEKIDGADTAVLDGNYEGGTLFCYNSNWFLK